MTPHPSYCASTGNKDMLLHTPTCTWDINSNSMLSVSFQFMFIFSNCSKILFIAVLKIFFELQSNQSIYFAFGLLESMIILLAFFPPSCHFWRAEASFLVENSRCQIYPIFSSQCHLTCLSFTHLSCNLEGSFKSLIQLESNIVCKNVLYLNIVTFQEMHLNFLAFFLKFTMKEWNKV